MAEQSGTSAYQKAERIWKAATADGDAITQRLLIADRAAATGRFENFWPTPTRSRVMSPTRRLLRDCYVRVVENQLARGITAPADSPIDGMEAERTMAAVRRRTNAESSIVVRVVVELARDGRRFADRVAKGRRQYLEAALRGRISKLFPRTADSSVSMRQALAEQWYVRSFRAAVEPPLYRLGTPPVTTAEVNAVGINLTTGQPRILYRDGRPLGPATPEGWSGYAATQWKAMTAGRRSAWLSVRAWGPEVSGAEFSELPLIVQAELLSLFPPTGPIMSQGLAAGTAIEAAAQAFGTTPVHDSSDVDRRLAGILFSRAGATLPRQVLADLPDDEPVRSSLDALHGANERHGEMRGHELRSSFWPDDLQRVRAVELRTSGMSFAAIGEQLGMSAHRVARGLREDSAIPTHLVRKADRHSWTEDEIRAVGYLRSQGRTYEQIATMFGYRTSQTVRRALTVHGPRRGIDPVTGRTIAVGEAAPDPTRWAPRISPWDGAPRRGEDPEAVAGRLAGNRRARTDGPTASSVRRDPSFEMVDRMVERRQAVTEPGAMETGPSQSRPSTDNRSTRRLH